MQVLQRSLPFDEHRVKILFALSKTEIPQKVLIALKKSKNNFDFDKVLELIPPIFLFRNRVVKSSNYQIKTENSVRSLSTGMRN